MTLILNNEEIRRALDVKECLKVMEEAYREQAASRAVNRPTSHSYLAHSLPQATYSFKSVDGGVNKFGVLALRITSDIVQEKKVGDMVRLEKLPLAAEGKFLGLVQLFSVETGELLAIMPDGLIQQTRVGVTSALGAKAMSRQNSELLALIGSGGQARSHFRFITSVLPIRKVRVFSPNPDHRKKLAVEMQRETGIAAEPVASVQEAIENCDIICTATNSSRPLIQGEWLKPGVHYNAIREFEVDESVFEKSDVVVIHTQFGGIQHYLPPGLKEDLPAIRREKPRDWSRYPEISDLLVGRVPGRTSDKQITFFLNNVGTGVQFAAMGYSAYRAAKEKGLGREIPTDWFLQDIKP